MADQDKPKAPRIGAGGGYFIGGWIAIAVGFFVGIATAGSLDAGVGTTFASGLIGLGVALIAVGFWVKLFGLIELRLIDIERRLPPVEPSEQTSKRPEASPADGYLG